MTPRARTKRAAQASASAVPQAPETFTLLAQVSRSVLGSVWKARENRTGRTVMLKLLDTANADDLDYVARFQRAFQRARGIHSRNMVQVLGTGLREGLPYAALEVTDGPSLRDLIAKGGPLGWKEARGRLAQVTQGLANAHAVGLTRIDLDPASITGLWRLR